MLAFPMPPLRPLSTLHFELDLGRRSLLDQEYPYFPIDINKYWPGPLTFVLPVKIKLDKSSLNEKGELAIRVSSNQTATRLSKLLGRPITATSANISGKGNCFSPSSIKRQFGNKRLKNIMLLSTGRLTRKKMSTVVRVRGDGAQVIRQGEINVN